MFGKRFAAALMALCLFLLNLPGARAELPAPFTGYFEQTSYMRSVPKIEQTSLKTIPEYTAVYMTPVNEKYARVEYEGVTGYIYYLSAKNMPKETAVTPYIVYSEGNKFLLDTPLAGAKRTGTIDKETPIYVQATVGGYYRVQAGEQAGYIRQKETARLKADTSIVSREVFTREKIAVHSLPLKNAPVVYTLEPRQVYLATARCRGYLKVSWGAQEGYVLSSALSTFSKDESELRVGLIAADAALYTRPDETFEAENRDEGTALRFLDGANNGFYHLEESGLYVKAEDVRAYALEAVAASQLYAENNVPLLLLPVPDALDAGASLRAGELYAAAYATDAYYLVRVGGVWGFVRKDAVSRLLAGEEMNRAAAVTTTRTMLYDRSGERVALEAGERIFLTQLADAFYLCTHGEKSGFVLKKDVRLIGADAPVDAYRVVAPHDVALMDFPSAALSRPAGVIKAGATLTVTGFNGCYLLVTSGDQAGYAMQDGLLSEETEGLPASEDAPRYELALDKSTRMVYAFELDETGARTDTIAASAKVAVGKRTTPTPSGTFVLGRKERWHRFTLSYTPHTTAYTNGRYIHGLPCVKKSASSVIDYLAHNAGQAVTGGCLRSPFEFARWVYLNCPSYLTNLVVVNGGLAVPEEETGPIPDEGAEPTDDEPVEEAPAGEEAPLIFG